ncbi:MAG: hypothetical protein HYS27_28425 [Deltaproteobacteria bacterium]|nr:hypothetical protein [Deltaproteobacteria bacterium]
MRALASLLLPPLACALLASAAAAAPTPVGLPHELTTAQRNLLAELKLARQQVDAALKLRKQRLEVMHQAVVARDAAAAALAAKKRAHDAAGLQAAQQKTFALDEEVTRARSAFVAAEATVARGGAELLSLYDALLAERRRAVDAAAGSARGPAVQAYRELAAQRDAVRQALLPVLADTPTNAAAPGADLEPRADDDVETLLEKADLARDLEQRLQRQMEAVRRRISELEEEQAVAKDVAGMVGRSALFDEEDRRLLVVRTETTTRAANNGPVAAIGGNDRDDANQGESSPPPAFDGEPSADADDVGAGAGGAPPADPAPPASIAPPPPAMVSSTTTLRAEQALAVPATDAGLQGMLSSSTNLSSLKALEKQLQANAVKARDKAKKLRVEAERRQ